MQIRRLAASPLRLRHELITLVMVAMAMMMGASRSLAEDQPLEPVEDEAEAVVEEPGETSVLPENSGQDLIIPEDPELLPELTGEEFTDAELLPGLGETQDQGDLFLGDILDEGEDEEGTESTELFGYSGDWSGGSAQDIRGQELLPGGFSSPLNREGFRFGLGTQVNYDSNVRLSETAEQSEYFFTVTPSVEYRSAPPEGVPGVVTASYGPIIRYYPDDSSLDTVDHFAEVSVDYTGTRGQVNAGAQFGSFSGGNQVVVGLTETETFEFFVETAYQATDRLSLNGELRFDSRSVDQEVGPVFDDEVSSLQLTAQWAVSPGLWMGPSVRHAVSDSDALGETETFGYTLAAGYRPPSIENLYLEGELGIETVDNNTLGLNSTDFTGNLSIDYQPDERLAIGGEVSYRAVPESVGFGIGGGGGGGQQLTGGLRIRYKLAETWSLNSRARVTSSASEAVVGESFSSTLVSLALEKQFLQGSAEIGAILRNTSYDVESAPAVPRGDDDSITAFLRYTRPILSDRAAFASSVQWTENSGDTDWSRFQVSSGVTFSF